jgi:dolichol-phosphate mannosyltransferase
VKNVRDYTCGYRLYNIDLLERGFKKFGEAFIEEAGFTCMAELLYKLYLVGAVFEEVPFVLRYDFKKGQSKMKVIKTARNSIRLAFRLRKLKKKI